MARKKYIDKNGNVKYYEYQDNYPKNHPEIVKLHKQKTYYKKKGDLERVKAIELLIQIEKRREILNGRS